MARHDSNIFSLKSQHNSSERSDWITYENVEIMYGLVYKQMFCAGVLEELEEEQYQDKFGNNVEKEKTSGLLVKYKVKLPNYILFVDKVGNNMCMSDNGQVGGSRYLGDIKGELVNIVGIY